MLSLFTPTGTDLVANPPPPSAIKASADSGVNVSLAVLAVENDLTLPLRQVQVTVDWNDGQSPVVYPYALTSSGTLTLNAANATRLLGVGEHVIRVQAQNLRAPEADTASVNFDVTILPKLQLGTPANLLYGPILPKDSGFPNAQQWDFNTGVDTEILESSVKMLLSTAKRERIMLPDYGTDLRLMVFDPLQDALQSRAEQEITDALTAWEPRVSLQSLNITRNPDESVTIDVGLLSALTQQSFTVTTVFTP